MLHLLDKFTRAEETRFSLKERSPRRISRAMTTRGKELIEETRPRGRGVQEFM
jgi:hypothetical protein